MEDKNIYRNCCHLLVSMMLSLVLVIPVSAKPVACVKEYQYQASEMDSKLSCRTIAIEQVKRLLLEEVGTYLISETTVKDFQLTKDQITSFTAGIVQTVILDEQWDGKTYSLKAKITADADDLVKSIDEVRRNQEQSRNWEEMRKKTEDALNEIERLKKEIGKSEVEKVRQEKYAKALNEFNVIDLFKKGWALRYNEKNNKEAMIAFDKVIEIDPNFAKAYAERAAIYNEWAEYEQAVRECDQAIKLDPDLASGFNTRGSAYIGLRNYQKAIEDLDRVIEFEPKYAWPYCSRSRAYYMLKDSRQALEDAQIHRLF